MNDKESKSEGVLYWERLAAATPPKLPKGIEAVGTRCARDGCAITERVSYEKPLCWGHWKEFDAFRLFECESCHWFDELVGEFSEDDLCRDCAVSQQRRTAAPPIYAHGPVERRVRHLYILKLDDGHWYVGQTSALELRVKEHQDGTTVSTRGKNPRLVWFRTWIGQFDELMEEESELTRVANENPRVIRRMVEEWQRPHRLVHWDA